jgi:hypothetical protein
MTLRQLSASCKLLQRTLRSSSSWPERCHSRPDRQLSREFDSCYAETRPRQRAHQACSTSHPGTPPQKQAKGSHACIFLPFSTQTPPPPVASRLPLTVAGDWSDACAGGAGVLTVPHGAALYKRPASILGHPLRPLPLRYPGCTVVVVRAPLAVLQRLPLASARRRRRCRTRAPRRSSCRRLCVLLPVMSGVRVGIVRRLLTVVCCVRIVVVAAARPPRVASVPCLRITVARCAIPRSRIPPVRRVARRRTVSA